MNSLRRNQSTDLQPKFSSAWCIFCWKALLSILYMSYLVLIHCLGEFAVVVIFIYLHMMDSRQMFFTYVFLLIATRFRNNLIKKSNFSNNILPFYSLC